MSKSFVQIPRVKHANLQLVGITPTPSLTAKAQSHAYFVKAVMLAIIEHLSATI
jgi:hypothetical protein